MGMQYENSNDPAKATKHYNQGMAMGDSASNYVSFHSDPNEPRDC